MTCLHVSYPSSSTGNTDDETQEVTAGRWVGKVNRKGAHLAKAGVGMETDGASPEFPHLHRF